MENSRLLEIRNLKTYISVPGAEIRAVDGVSFKLSSGETLAIVGESGCGKSTIALSIMRLIPDPPGKIVEGEILFDGEDLISFSRKEMEKIRGSDISLLFQEPLTALNPVLTIGEQISEIFRYKMGIDRKEALSRSIELLHAVRIPQPHIRIKAYPHQLSGGMRQRVMIAMALSLNPRLLIADEPTTALDVTIQAQIIHLLNRLKEERGLSLILITHDLGVVAEMARDVLVIYMGKVMEYGDIFKLFDNPLHPYFHGLLSSLPFSGKGPTKKIRLEAIPGQVPSLLTSVKGCKFSSRCKYAWDLCFNEEPPIKEVETDHLVRCWRYN